MLTFMQHINENPTKTEKKLLDKAHKSGNKRVSVTSEIGGTGEREKKAFFGLVKKGHIIHEPQHSSSDHEFTRDKKRRKRMFNTVVGRVHPSSTYKPTE